MLHAALKGSSSVLKCAVSMPITFKYLIAIVTYKANKTKDNTVYFYIFPR